ncbi:prolyl oligopeptidase family serine peptidase [Glaciimonas sp. GS1]|uniref:Prolyl oligopeptidase family serine peptidase n=1 Tax=Glaciimonas soli TaxID=2590999 RepID=A0A843YZ00_9BURK|nr:prolyl oligopeptidase family serine peptidase [Glaciimonas soli]
MPINWQHLRQYLIFVCIFTLSLFARANIIEVQNHDAMEMPHAPMHEKVLNITGDPDRPVTLQVTEFTPPGPGPFPLAVLNHGAIGDTSPESQPRFRITYAADYFLSRGYAVILPMMRGYAGSDGAVTAHGCNAEAMGLSDAKDIRAVISYFVKQPNIDAQRIVVAGQSFGGWNTLAFGTLDYPNVKGLINFAGGVIASSCWSSKSSLENGAEDFGAQTHIPSIWFYGDNDKLFSVATWRAMHDRYNAAGGDAELVAYGSFMENSHVMLNYPEAHSIWVPKLDAFLEKVGLPNRPIYPEYMPTVFPAPIPQSAQYAAIDDVNAVPYLNDQGRALYQHFLTTKQFPRVFAIGKNGAASAQSGGFDPIAQALTNCQKSGRQCQIYAIDNDVVWNQPAARPLAPVPAATHFAALEDPTAIPYINDAGRQGYSKFLTFKKPRAFVISPSGHFSGASRGDDPVAQALALCKKTSQGCQLYAVDDAVVWPEEAQK